MCFSEKENCKHRVWLVDFGVWIWKLLQSICRLVGILASNWAVDIRKMNRFPNFTVSPDFTVTASDGRAVFLRKYVVKFPQTLICCLHMLQLVELQTELRCMLIGGFNKSVSLRRLGQNPKFSGCFQVFCPRICSAISAQILKKPTKPHVGHSDLSQRFWALTCLSSGTSM